MGGLNMATPRKLLTAKQVENSRAPGKYAAGKGIFLIIGKTPNSKSWLKRYRFRGKRREMGLGSYPTVSLADARAAGAEADRLIANKTDPIDHRQKQDSTQWLANNTTFQAIADDMIDSKSKLGEEPWKKATADDAKYTIANWLSPIAQRPIDQITAVDLFDLVLKPMLEKKIYRSATKARIYAQQVFRWGYGRNALKVEHANPASLSGPLGVLLHGFKYRGGHLPSLDWSKVPALCADIKAHIHGKWVSLTDAGILVGKPKATIRDHVLRGQLKADRSPKGAQEWRVETDELFKQWPPIADLVPPPKRIQCYMLLVSILTAVRPGEARFARWSEYDPVKKLWTIPWQRTKEGRKIRRDHVIPLYPAVCEMFDLLRGHQHRKGIYQPDGYIFAQFPGIKNAKKLWPPTSSCVLVTLREFLDSEDADKSLHGMRDAFGSWSDERGFREKDKERALGHIKGFGEDDVSRRYSRQSKRHLALTELFYSWAEFCLGGSKPIKVIPIREHLKRSIGA